MDDPNQIEVPPSFVALFTGSGGYRLTRPMAEVRERYELCEDLAQMLCEQASTAAFKSGAAEGEVLAGMRTALSSEGGPLQAPEPAWVVTRIAEILGWELPGPG
ncbi:MAG TPA: hypothetical protein VF522_08075 [Ramlibacter sp.]|uniref:hypothetical protein n=1 Tax=Ramlibacter sp. TaxID=1917967 RepID=UPI002ED32B70